MSKMSEVFEELRVNAVWVRKCWTETEILDVLKEVKDYALDSPRAKEIALQKTLAKKRSRSGMLRQ